MNTSVSRMMAVGAVGAVGALAVRSWLWQANRFSFYNRVVIVNSAGTMAMFNRLLPAPGGIGRQARKGSQNQTSLSPSWITTLNEGAAVRNNEILSQK